MDMYNFFTTFVYPPWGQLDESKLLSTNFLFNNFQQKA